jgi:hypothetical protein
MQETRRYKENRNKKRISCAVHSGTLLACQDFISLASFGMVALSGLQALAPPLRTPTPIISQNSP